MEKVFYKPEGKSKITCFHCKQQGHQSFECPKRINLIEAEGDGRDTQDDPKDKEIEVEEISLEEGGETLVVLMFSL